MRRTKIVATLGPATDDRDILKSLIGAGVDVVRLNLSHGAQADHAKRIEAIKDVRRQLQTAEAIMVDTKGPEIRLGTFAGGFVELEDGQEFTLVATELEGSSERVFVDYRDLWRDVSVGATVLLDDGNIELEVLAALEGLVRCRVINGGALSNQKKVNIPGKRPSLPTVSDRDRDDIAFAVEQGVDFIAASFVHEAGDVIEVRRTIEQCGGSAHIIAKIENPSAVDNLDGILDVSDGLMVARGDLGVEIPAEDVPVLQKEIIRACSRKGKPVITATQMLESMVERPRPTRAEASDVANAIFDGTDAVMLSAETAVGEYPVEAVKYMHRIACRAESALDYREILDRQAKAAARSVPEAISHATCAIALDLGTNAIITATTSGHTARMVAKYRPAAPIIAATNNEAVVRKLNLVWGVRSILVPDSDNTDEAFYNASVTAVEAGLINKGDLVVITAGAPVGVPGTTNLLKVQVVGDVICRGTGIGNAAARGSARVARNAAEAEEKLQEGDILVTFGTDRDFVALLDRVVGIVAEEGGLTSHTALMGLDLGVPVIVGVEDATSLLSDGQEITLDATRGFVYAGEARIL